jgi:hypothetical protein
LLKNTRMIGNMDAYETIPAALGAKAPTNRRASAERMLARGMQDARRNRFAAPPRRTMSTHPFEMLRWPERTTCLNGDIFRSSILFYHKTTDAPTCKGATNLLMLN